MRCGALLHVAVRYGGALRSCVTLVRYGMLRCVAARCGTLQFVTVRCGTLRHLAVRRGVLRNVAASCGALQRVAERCGALRYVAMRYDIVTEHTHTHNRSSVLPNPLSGEPCRDAPL